MTAEVFARVEFWFTDGSGLVTYERWQPDFHQEGAFRAEDDGHFVALRAEAYAIVDHPLPLLSDYSEGDLAFAIVYKVTNEAKEG